ncbi:MAG: hypothetical protein Q8868_08405 [Bacteroidota bacterium]|nr:hypothetical protein [Bacteroidota bacterium]
MMRRTFVSGLLFIYITAFTNSQILISPNYSLKSHETLNIKKIEAENRATIFYMSVENRRVGGTFCADKNIYIVYPDGKRIKLTSAIGIPTCPDAYNFKTTGEKLDFTLEFPPVKPGTKWIDLVEDCPDNCFSFYGICLDGSLNKRLDNAFELAENGDEAKALNIFISIAGELDKENQGIAGLIYINIIKLARETGDNAKAEEWYGKFKLSDTPRLPQYIKFLNDKGIKY